MKLFSPIGVAALLLATLVVTVGMAFPTVQETPPIVKIPAPIAQETPKPVPANPAQQTAAADSDEFAPVEDMHHFMEYVCEPSYKGLKQILASEPENRAAWKAFKNHALVLAETSALVAARAPEDSAESEQWKQISLEVYKSGAALYKSAGKYEEAKKHYGLMLDQCNKCHTVFAEGKHQLTK